MVKQEPLPPPASATVTKQGVRRPVLALALMRAWALIQEFVLELVLEQEQEQDLAGITVKKKTFVLVVRRPVNDVSVIICYI